MDDKIATGYSPSFIARIEKRNANIRKTQEKDNNPKPEPANKVPPLLEVEDEEDDE